VEIRDVDRADETALREFWEVGKAAENAARPYDWWTPWEGARVSYVTPRPGSRLEMLAAYEDGTTVGTAAVNLPTMDNLHLGFVGVHVRPSHQRRGVGSALLGRVEELLRGEGRRVAMGDAYAPPGEDSPALRFAHRHGYTDALEDGMKVVDLLETEPSWDAIEEEVQRRVGGYRLVSWTREVPDELLADYIHLNEAFNDEAPTGEMELEREVWDEERVRGGEKQAREVGRYFVAVAALAPGTSQMVGLTEIMVSEHATQRGFQSGTLVLPAHRGHALGLAMKVANQRQVRRVFPDCRVLLTGNAGVNVAMNAVNDRLGYREVERCVEVQKELAP
jgi:GNAT superfamily N-acetyltransferase